MSVHGIWTFFFFFVVKYAQPCMCWGKVGEKYCGIQLEGALIRSQQTHMTWDSCILALWRKVTKMWVLCEVMGKTQNSPCSEFPHIQVFLSMLVLYNIVVVAGTLHKLKQCLRKRIHKLNAWGREFINSSNAWRREFRVNAAYTCESKPR